MDFFKMTEFNIKLDRDNVFFLMDCKKENPVYEELNSEYDEVETEFLKKLKPVAFYKFGKISEELANQIDAKGDCHTPVIYVLMSIGDEVTELGSSYFAKGDYVLGMLINAMADTYLFQMDNYIQSVIRQECLSRHFGIAKRLEAPSNVPMSIQEDILEQIKEVEPLSIGVTRGYMFTTVKTMGYLLVLTEDEGMNHAGHDCSTCSAKNCRMRKHKQN